MGTSFKTRVEYARRYLFHVAFAERRLGRPAKPIEVVECFLARHGELSPSSIRFNRSAILYGLNAHALKHPKLAGNFDPAIEALGLVHANGRGAGPTPSAKADRKTSATKRKSLTMEQAEAVFHALASLRHMHAGLAALFVRFGPELGLRPSEYATAKLVGSRLFVRNAKHTNGRGCGRRRVLDLSRYPIEYRDALRAFLDRIRTTIAANGGAWDRVAEGLNRALRAASNASGISSLRKSPVVLYTLRHVASARMKAAGFSRDEVAAMLGHISEDTAAAHYARKHTGRGWGDFLTQPSARNVAIVRAVYIRLQAQKPARVDEPSEAPPMRP